MSRKPLGHAFMMATRLPKLRVAAIFYGRNPDPIDLVKNIQADTCSSSMEKRT
jgi:hypothetical protein